MGKHIWLTLHNMGELTDTLITIKHIEAWRICTNDLIHKSHNAPVPYPTMHQSEHKCSHFCSEWCIVGYGTGASWEFLRLVYSPFPRSLFSELAHSLGQQVMATIRPDCQPLLHFSCLPRNLLVVGPPLHLPRIWFIGSHRHNGEQGLRYEETWPHGGWQ